jgi:excisionase family DNA binding protein
MTVCATAVEPRLNNPDCSSHPKNQLKHHQSVSETNYKKLAYTVEEAAELLSLSRAHVYRLLDLGQLGSISIGRSRRITSAQLSDFLKGLEQRSGLPRSATRF